MSSPNTGQITAANAGGTSDVSLLTAGSFFSVNLPDGPNTVLIDLSGTWSASGGLQVLFVPTQNPAVVTATTLVRVIVQSSITAQVDNSKNGLVSGATGTFFFGQNGAGTIYVVAPSSTWSGTANITIRFGPGVLCKHGVIGRGQQRIGRVLSTSDGRGSRRDTWDRRNSKDATRGLAWKRRGFFET